MKKKDIFPKDVEELYNLIVPIDVQKDLELIKLEEKRKGNAKQRKYYSEHKDKFAANQRKYCSEHKEEINAKQRKYYSEHKDKFAAKQRKYYSEHKEEICLRRSKCKNKEMGGEHYGNM